MSDVREKEGQAELTVKIKRVRTRLAAGVKTGAQAGGSCPLRTDPTENGRICPTIGTGCFGSETC
jgi:hypothetical protein